MAKKKKRNPRMKDRLNNWRQKQYLQVGVVMLPDLKTERSTVMNLIESGQYKKEDNA